MRWFELIEIALAELGILPTGEEIKQSTIRAQQGSGRVSKALFSASTLFLIYSRCLIEGSGTQVVGNLALYHGRRFRPEFALDRPAATRMHNVPSRHEAIVAPFAGNNRLRTMVRGTSYGMAGLNGMKVSVLDTAFRTPAQNAASGVGRLATRWGVIGIIFVTAVDVADWYAQPANEREFTDLLVDLGLNLATTVISAIAGTVIAGFAIGAIAAAPVVLFVAAGLLASVVVGFAISAIVNATGLRDGLKEALRNTQAVPDDIYQGMMTAP